MSKVDINICSCTGDCEDLKLLDTNKKDDTKENLLEVIENKDLLEIETGVPFTKKTKVYPKRDKTKLNVKTFEEYKKFNEDIINNKFNLVNDDIDKLKNKDDILSEALTKKANLEDLEKKADRKDLDLKADKSDLDLKADKTELDLKADKKELDSKADKTELDKKADKDFINGELESYGDTLTEFGKLMDKKSDKSELDKKADKSELDKKADKSELDKKADKSELDKKADKNYLKIIVTHKELYYYEIEKGNTTQKDSITDMTILRFPRTEVIIERYNEEYSFYYTPVTVDFSRIENGYIHIEFLDRWGPLLVLEIKVTVDENTNEVILSDFIWQKKQI